MRLLFSNNLLNDKSPHPPFIHHTTPVDQILIVYFKIKWSILFKWRLYDSHCIRSAVRENLSDNKPQKILTREQTI